MATIAELGIRVDSADAAHAADDLDRLVDAGGRAEKAAAGVEQGAKKAGKAFRDQSDDLAQLLGEIDPTVKALGRLDELENRLAKQKKFLGPEAFSEYQGKIQQAREDLTRFDDSLTRTGNTAKQNAAALRGVPAQFTDIFVSLQGGQAPLTVFLQQGGQLKDMFGGIAPAAQALGGYIAGLVNPFTVAAAAVGTLGLAYYQGSEEQDSFRQSLVTTGNAAGATTAGLAAMARQVSSTVGTTGAAAAVLSQLAGTGKIVSSSFEQIAIAALSLEKATGRAASETVAEFAKLADDPVKAVVALNEKYHFLTAAVFSQIHALQEQGDTLGAQQVAEGAYADALTKRAEEIQRNLGYVERAWDSAKGAAKGAWDAFLDIGREETFEDKLRQLEQRANIGAGGLGGGLLSGFEAAQGSKAEIGKEWTGVLQQEVDDQARARAAMFEAGAVERGTKAYQALQKAIESTAPKSEKLKKALDENRRQVEEARRAGYTITAEQEAALEAQTKAKFKPAAGRSSAVDLSSFNDQKNALNAILAEYKNHQKELDAAQKAGLISQESYAAQRAAIIEQQRGDVTHAYEAEIKALEEAKGRSTTSAQQRIQLDQKIAEARAAMVKAQKDADSELAVLATNEQGRLAKQARAVQTYTDALNQQVEALRLQGQRAADGLGLGDRQRSLQDQQNGITDRFNQQRLDLANQYGDGSRGMSLDEYNQKLAALGRTERDLQETAVANYERMTEAQSDWRKGASSAFQNYLEQARDVAGQTRSLFTNAFGSMEDAVVNFAMTGKFSFADFTKSVLADIAKIAARQALAGIAGSILGSVGGYFSPGGTTVSSSGFSEGGFVQNAKGGVYDSPSLSSFSNQVHSTPQFFAFAKGAGVFGEAGPEAIMPLTRTSDGNLGVRAIAGGGSSGGVSLSINAPVSVSIPDRSGEGMELDQALLQQNMQKQMQVAAEKAVADSWRPGGVSFRNTNRRG